MKISAFKHEGVENAIAFDISARLRHRPGRGRLQRHRLAGERSCSRDTQSMAFFRRREW
jgi:hypothetical protein